MIVVVLNRVFVILIVMRMIFTANLVVVLLAVKPNVERIRIVWPSVRTPSALKTLLKTTTTVLLHAPITNASELAPTTISIASPPVKDKNVITSAHLMTTTVKSAAIPWPAWLMPN